MVIDIDRVKICYQDKYTFSVIFIIVKIKINTLNDIYILATGTKSVFFFRGGQDIN